MNARIGTALVALVLVAGCSAKAPDSGATAVEGAAPTFRSLDINADGSLTPDEAEYYADLSAVFVEADADSDGRLSSAEYDDAVQNLIAS
jgi:hypothetical protein